MLGFILKAGIALAALAVGIWLGMPGRYSQTVDEIEEAMERGGGRRRRVKRIFTPMAWVERKAGIRRPSSDRRAFKLESPDDP